MREAGPIMASSRHRSLAPLRSDLPGPGGEWHPHSEWPPPLGSSRFSEAGGGPAAGDTGLGAADPRTLLPAGRIGSASVPLPPCGISPRKALVAPALRGSRLAAKSTAVQCALEPHWGLGRSPRAGSSVVCNTLPGSTSTANTAESSASVADVTGLPSSGQQGAIDLTDSKNAEVVHYHWHVVRNQLSAMKGEVAEVRAAVEALRCDNQRREEQCEDLAKGLRDSQRSVEAVERKGMEHFDIFMDKINDNQANLNSQVRQALQESEKLLQSELAQVKEEQAKLRDQCALKEVLETAEASLRRQMTACNREDKTRHADHCKHVETCVSELDRKINTECRRMTEELSLHTEEMRRLLDSNMDRMENTRAGAMRQLSSEHHTRHDNLHQALTDTSEDLKQKIADAVGTAFESHSKDLSELREKFDDALEELDVKIHEVEALYCEASEKRLEAYALRKRRVFY